MSDNDDAQPPREHILREPRRRTLSPAAGQSVGRLTVRELMERLNSDDAPPIAAGRLAGGTGVDAPPTGGPGSSDNTVVENTVVEARPAAYREPSGHRIGPRRWHSTVTAATGGDRIRTITTASRILVATACVLALIGTGSVWGYLKQTNGKWNTIHAVDAGDRNIRNIGAQSGDQNYLIVGTDSRSGMNGKVGAGTTADAGGARSDTVILVNVPANRSRVVAVSFPRDLQIDRPACTAWDNDTGKYTSEVVPAENGAKLNTAYGYGGPRCAVEVLTKMTGLNINHFIAMDFVGFEKVVNKIGGVRVCSTTPLYDYELGDILRRPGAYTLKGQKALNYVRARTIESEGNGDYGRIKRQQLFMSSLLRSVLSSNVLSNPTKLNGIISTFIKNSYVDNINTDSVLDLAQSMQGLQAGRVTFLTIPTAGTTTDGSNNEIPRTSDINAMFNAVIDDAPLPGEARLPASPKKAATARGASAPAESGSPQAPVTVTAPATTPSTIGVRVLNGTGNTGVATGVSNSLGGSGFNVRGVADASQLYDTTIVRYGDAQRDAAATVAAMIPGSYIQRDASVKSGVEVIIGKDYPGRLGTAPTTGERVTVTQLPESHDRGALPDDLSVTNAGDTTCQ